ncbi:hypothetical protein ACJ51O_30385 [Burkholderia pyrrocinia]|uniref:hypothetical protein n=1 Tax=Burkholderia TaxID=32008 RepID=UPI00158E74DC|nr:MULTISPECIES: hypothetical protein [Burkholderia]UOB57293.1 hypothetical protein MRS60_24070 [Burkholderia pyrrocinia]
MSWKPTLLPSSGVTGIVTPLSLFRLFLIVYGSTPAKLTPTPHGSATARRERIETLFD